MIKFLKRKWDRIRDFRNLRKSGVILVDGSYRREQTEDLIINFMKSINRKVEDFSDILKSMNIILPVKLSLFVSGSGRVKFVETNGREGDLKLVAAYKNEAENYEVKPKIILHSYYNHLIQMEEFDY